MEYFARPGPALLFFLFRFEYLISGSKKLSGLSRNGPLGLIIARGRCVSGHVVRAWSSRSSWIRHRKCIDREGLGSQEWRGSGTMRVYKVKPFNRYGKHDGIKGKNFSSRNRLSFLKFWDRSLALWHLKKVFHVISFHFDVSILVVDESYYSLLCLGLRP